VIWARKNQLKVALQEIHWAREVLGDPDRRVRADAASLNPDTLDGVLRGLAERFGAGWEPLDIEKPPAEDAAATEVPNAAEVRDAITLPPLPREAPAVARLLEQFLQEPLDPWELP
jgi:hypothetical protein